MSEEKASWIHEVSDNTLHVRVNTSVYPLEVIFRVCYVFTDRCYLFLFTDDDNRIVDVQFTRKHSDCNVATIAGEFSNELINQRVRWDIANETRPIRELIVAQAFAEADFADRAGCEASYTEDPRGIATTK